MGGVEQQVMTEPRVQYKEFLLVAGKENNVSHTYMTCTTRGRGSWDIFFALKVNLRENKTRILGIPRLNGWIFDRSKVNNTLRRKYADLYAHTIKRVLAKLRVV